MLIQNSKPAISRKFCKYTLHWDWAKITNSAREHESETSILSILKRWDSFKRPKSATYIEQSNAHRNNHK